MEFYLGDSNLATDDFFRKKIQEDKAEGFINLEVFFACNNIKKMNITMADIAMACADSKELELSKD